MSGPLVQALEKRRQEDLAKTQPLTPGTLEWAWAQAQKPFQGFADRQKKIAGEGLLWADQGAQQVQQGDLSGLAGMMLGPMQWAFSYPSALLPDDSATREFGRSVGGKVGESVAAGARGLGEIYMPGPDIMSYAPAMFLGVAAKNANKLKLAKAQELEAAGQSPAVVYGETGWFKGADGKWRFEISDDKAQLGFHPDELAARAQSQEGGGYYPVGTTVLHKELYDNYPELRRIRVYPESGLGGGMNTAENSLHLGVAESADPAIRKDYVKSVALHELQHAIQSIEGFAPGAAKSVADRNIDDYLNNAGEVEARNVQRRMNWTPDQRRMAPWVSEDVPRDKQIVSGATQTGGIPSSVTRDQALANLTEAPEGITAYHGSPHTFDKFDMSKIGTGEGAQAYGHGLYFAENEAVSKGYRDTLSKETLRTANGDVFDPQSLEHLSVRVAANRNGTDLDATIARAKEVLASANDQTRPMAERDLAKLSQLKAVGGVSPNPGSMYQVRLNVKPDELLDWDRPLSEQPIAERTKEILKSSGIEAEVKQVGLDPMSMTGEGLHGWIRDPKQATKATEQLKAAGIKGIRYKDQGSRSSEGGTYNYVIFDDKLVDILKRYAIPFTLGAGGAAIVSGQDMPPEVASQLGPQA